MSKLAIVYLDNVPVFQISFNKNTTIKGLKSVLDKYFIQNGLPKSDYTLKFFIKENTEIPIFKDSKYDDRNLQSVWDSIENPQFFIIGFNNKFTGNKDVDMLILKSLDDISIGNLCKINKYLSELCQKLYKDNKFWEDRMRNVVHPYIFVQPKGKNTWHQHYVKFFKYSDNQWKNLIKKILTQVHPDTSISKDGVEYILSLVKPIWNKIKKIPNDQFDDVMREMFWIKDEFQMPLGNAPTLYDHAMSEFISEGKRFFVSYDRKRIIEYLIAEILEISGITARNMQRHRITKEHIKKAILNDYQMMKLFDMESKFLDLKVKDFNQVKLGMYIRYYMGKDTYYFDDADLVDTGSSRTILPDVLSKKTKYTIRDVLEAVRNFK